MQNPPALLAVGSLAAFAPPAEIRCQAFLVEAAACGLPVVTTRVGNMPELIRDGENGFFVERDAADIAAKLCQLRDDPGLRERLGRAAPAPPPRGGTGGIRRSSTT